jgi:hypothetical protein
MDADRDLEGRLRALPTHVRLSTADAAAVRRLAASPAPHQPRPRRRPLLAPAVAGLLAALVAGNGVATYFAPRYAAAIASAPGVGVLSGPVLHWTGLSASQVTVLGDSVTASGHTLRLVAGRADELRTVLILEVDGVVPKVSKEPTNAWTVGDYPTLTDQFGHTYSPSGVGYGFNFEYQPLTGPAASVGGRLTVHVTSLTRPPATPAGSGAGRGNVSGDWTLRATLFLQPAPALTLPAPVTFEGATYRLTSARAGGLVVVHWTADGPFEEARQRAYAPNTPEPNGPARAAAAPPPDPFRVTVTGPDGSQASGRGGGYSIPRRGPITGEATFFASKPGIYHIRIGSAPDLTLDVPAEGVTGP